jgi:hypothetical protein
MKLFDSLKHVRDGRDSGRIVIPLKVLLVGVLAMYWFQLPSLAALDDQLRHHSWLRRVLAPLGYGAAVADDTFRNAFAKLDADGLHGILHQIGRKLLKGWGAGRYRDSQLARKLAPLGMQKLAGKLTIIIDGHHLFETRHVARTCNECLQRSVLVNGQHETAYYHHVLVAQVMGAHPAVILDFEPLLPGENELVAVRRLLPRLKEAYGERIGVVVADAMYDNEPFRRLVNACDYRSVLVHKVDRSTYGKAARAALDRRDPERVRPDYKHHAGRGVHYHVWDQAAGGRRLIEVRRNDRSGKTWKSQAMTDLPADQIHAVAVGLLLESRWEVENKGFKQLVEDWNLDRAYVHAKKPRAVRAFVALALLAYNALHQFIYRVLGLDPVEPERALQAVRRDLIHTLVDLGVRGPPHARSP